MIAATSSALPLVLVALYFVACLAIGLWALRRTRDARDYFVAGRRLGPWVTAVALFSSVMSGFAFVGGPGLVYRDGLSSMWMVVSGILGTCLSTALVGKRLRLLAEVRGALSLPEALAARYDSEAVRGLSALAIAAGVLAYLATQIAAMALVLQGLLAQSSLVAEAGATTCAVLATAVLVGYCVLGGALASVATDLLQGAMMMAASALVFFAVRAQFEGGYAEAFRTIAEDDAAALGPFGTQGAVTCLSWFFLFALGGSGQPHIVTKNLMFRRIADLRRILPLTILTGTIATLLWLVLGVGMRALVLQGRVEPLATADRAAPAFLELCAEPWVAGVVFAALFAAIMSTADAFLNLGAAALVRDLPRAFGWAPPRHELRWARVATVALGGAALGFALGSRELVAFLGSFGWSTFAAALVPTVAIGLNWKRAHATAACASMATGLAATFGVEIAQRLCGVDLRLPHGFDRGAAALLLSLLVFLVVARATPPRPLPRDIDMLLEL
ncbi:MAG: sodium/proline symporter [Planctomycetes bacterium]|nr:sodium/proline symporter [Planctomycetota bacterium]